MTSYSDSINKKRQRNDKWGRYIVTGFGGLVLLTLVILISHLVSQALPLALVPNIEKEHQLALPEGSQVESAGDLLGGQLVVTNGEDCRLSLYGYKRHDFAKHHDYIRPCDHQLATTSLMGENAIVDISAGGQVRVVPVRSLANRESFRPFSSTFKPCVLYNIFCSTGQVLVTNYVLAICVLI